MTDITPHQAKYFADQLTRKTSPTDRQKLISAVLNAKVNPLPHQIDAALFAFRSPFSRGAILADEVGLGKTIEAGIVLSQKWAEGKRRLLIVAPANLRQQWAGELLDKFYLPSIIVDSAKRKKALEDNQPVFPGDQVAIVSYNFAATNQELFQAFTWDLVVFDEAHKLRNVYKSENITAKAIKETFAETPKLLLTATPLQNSLLELYGLVSIIDDEYFGRFDAFKDEYTNIGPGRKGDRALDELRNRLKPIINRSLRRHVQEYIKYTNRQAFTQQFTPTPEETQLYEMVTEYLSREELYAFSSSQRPLVTLLLLKTLGSSSYAISHTLENVAKRVEAEANEGVRRSKSGKKIFDEDLLRAVREDADQDDLDDDQAEALSQEVIAAMRREATELHEMANLAKAITHESKGDALLSAIERGFKELPRYNAKRKAIIFTESTRTQKYLVDLLNSKGYGGKVVAFNGSGGGTQGEAIYKEWLKRHAGTDIISGVATADRRQAIVEYFRDEAEIMVATEAAGEGINLQFCSMVINYDLPWNPQRVEQRIGRCHRYGQKSDVLVFNFVNQNNRAEQRILQLLADKFQLFNGVFGASDEILGAIENGFDFERNIADIIIRSVRTPDQIDRDFDKIQDQYSERINRQKRTTKQRLIDNFDSEVHEKLRIAKDQYDYYMNRDQEWLWLISQHILADYATFDGGGFTLHTKPPFAANAPLGTYSYSEENKTAQHRYRFNHPLAQAVLDRAKKLSPGAGTLQLNYSGSKPKISVLQQFAGQGGSLTVQRYSRISKKQHEEYYIVLAKTASGEAMTEDAARKLFELPANFMPGDNAVVDIQKETDEAIAQIEYEAKQRDQRLIQEEFDKIDARAADLRRSARLALKKREAEIRQKKKDFQAEIDMAKRLELQREYIAMQRKQDDEEQAFRARGREIDDEMLSLNAEVQASIEAKPNLETVFTVNWQLT